MEENEQSSTNAKTEGVVEQTSNDVDVAENAGSEITEPRAKIKIEGQEFELDAALAQDDKTLKVVLQPHFASIENANITRETKDGRLTVNIVKRAQHKGHR